MAYTYQHYPLAMYRGGVYRAVSNETEEAAAAAEGFTDYVNDREGRRLEGSAAADGLTQAAPAPTATAPTQSTASPVTPTKRKPGRQKKA